MAISDTPAIAVVIPCYNDGEYLGEVLQSLFSQDFADWEAVVVDDCSTDPATAAVIAAISNPQVKVIRHEENRGLSAARNTGIRATTAPIIFPLDADDRLAEGALRAAFEAMNKWPGVGLVYSDLVRFGAEDSVMGLPDFDIDRMVDSHFPSPCSPFRRVYFDRAGGFPEAPVFRLGMEDVAFHAAMIESGCVYKKIPVTLYEYRVKPGSLSNRMQLRYYDLRRSITDRHPVLFRGERRQRFLWYGAVRSMRTAMQAGHISVFFLNLFRAAVHTHLRPRAVWCTLWHAKEAATSRSRRGEARP